MNALDIGETLFVHTQRRGGFLLLASLAALLTLSLAGTTSFGLGRELLVIREAAFGTLYLSAFLGALLAAVFATSAEARRWTEENHSRALGVRNVDAGLLLQSLLAGLWVALFLTPFLVASLALFHGSHLLGGLACLLGILPVPVTLRLESAGFPPFPARTLPTLAGAALSAPLLLALPQGSMLFAALGFSFAPVFLACLIPGTFAILLPGPGGWILSLGLFGLSNMREALVRPAGPGWLASLLPDLSNLNPSLVASRIPAPGWPDFAGAFVYCAIFGLGTVVLVLGVATVKESAS